MDVAREAVAEPDRQLDRGSKLQRGLCTLSSSEASR